MRISTSTTTTTTLLRGHPLLMFSTVIYRRDTSGFLNVNIFIVRRNRSLGDLRTRLPLLRATKQFFLQLPVAPMWFNRKFRDDDKDWLACQSSRVNGKHNSSLLLPTVKNTHNAHSRMSLAEIEKSNIMFVVLHKRQPLLRLSCCEWRRCTREERIVVRAT